MDRNHEIYLKEAITNLFSLAADLAYDSDDLEKFRKWAKVELLLLVEEEGAG